MNNPKSELHTFEELALATGRFEMETTANQGNMHYKSLIGIEEASVLGLFDAAAILAPLPETTATSRVRLLDSLGDRAGEHWKLRPPVSSLERGAWKKLLASDQALVFVATNKEGWLEHLIASLYVPMVAVFPTMSLTESWLRLERGEFKGHTDLLHISTGALRADFTFVGVGPTFERAIAIAAYRPLMMWGYTPAAFKDTQRSRKMIFPVRKS